MNILPALTTGLGFALGGPVGMMAGASLGGGMAANAANSAQAARQMDFQEDMSNTAYQRAVKDMEFAGLNPALAYSQGPASSPGGAMAPQSDPYSSAVASAFQANQMENLKLQNLRIRGGKIAETIGTDGYLKSLEAVTPKKGEVGISTKLLDMVLPPADLSDSRKQQTPLERVRRYFPPNSAKDSMDIHSDYLR